MPIAIPYTATNNGSTMRISLGHKLGMIVGFLGLVVVGISAFALHQTAEERERQNHIADAWDASVKALTLAQAIEHAVVQATAVYIAADTEEAKSRFAPLAAALAEIERARSAFLAATESGIPADRRRRIDLAVKEFVAYQTDTAELGQTISPKADVKRNDCEKEVEKHLKYSALRAPRLALSTLRFFA